MDVFCSLVFVLLLTALTDQSGPSRRLRSFSREVTRIQFSLDSLRRQTPGETKSSLLVPPQQTAARLVIVTGYL